MQHSELYRLEYSFLDKIPLIPVRLSGTDNHGKKILTQPLRGVLDSGASDFTISKAMAEFLHLKLKKIGEGDTAGNKVDLFHTKGDFVIGLGKESIFYENVKISVLDSDTPILLGIDPIWYNFVVTIDAHAGKIILEPRKSN